MRRLCYPYFLTVKNKNIILIWFTNDDGIEVFYKSHDKIFAAYTTDEVDAKLNEIEFDMNWHDTNAIINLDTFFNTLGSITENEYISIDVCKTVLETWNFFEDFVNTYSNEPISFVRKNDILDKMYHKFFYGNNLQAVTPKGKSYNPVFLKNEIIELKRLMKDFWDFADKKLFRFI